MCKYLLCMYGVSARLKYLALGKALCGHTEFSELNEQLQALVLLICTP